MRPHPARSVLAFQACKSLIVDLFSPGYRLVSKKGEGTFSEVLKAQSVKDGKYVAVKCMKKHFDTLEQARALQQQLLLSVSTERNRH